MMSPSLDALATQVADELRLAGLHRREFVADSPGGFGVQKMQDRVTVIWTPSVKLMEAAFRHMESGNSDHPQVLHAGQVKHTMASAIVEILVSAGISAQISTDDMSPATVEVTLLQE